LQLITNSRRNSPHRVNIVLAIVFLLLVLIGVGTVSIYSLLTVVLDGGAALLVVGPLCLGGWALVPLIRANRLAIRWQFLLAAAFGIGVGANLVLILGLFGFLSRPLWLGVLTLAVAAGMARIWSERRDSDPGESSPSNSRSAGSWRYLLFLIVPFAVIALLAASAAPGVFWSEEGYGYDALEYHLELPKEYFLAGRISYAPHNVYANFPANVEMLYLLSMIVLDDTRDVGTVAQFIHLFLAMLTVYAAWVIARDWSPRAGIVAAVVMGTCGWMVYLSALAYNDNGVLFFGIVAIGALFRAQHAAVGIANGESQRDVHDRSGLSPKRWLMICGVLAGLTCGCKYTAVAFIALPIICIAPFICRQSRAMRVKSVALVAMGTGVAFAPWLVKNAAFTGNPVFPLANTVFHAHPPGFGAEQTLQWNIGHEPPTDEQGVKRFSIAFQRIVTDPQQRFGPVIFILAVMGFGFGRSNRESFLLAFVLIIQIAVWLFATHLFARFATPWLLPLSLLAAQTVRRFDSPWRLTIPLVTVAGAAFNFAYIENLYAGERGGLDAAPASLFYDGKLPGFEYLGFINHELPTNAHLLMVGDSKAFYIQRRVDYCVVFNESPLARLAQEHSSASEIMQWLRSRGITHVLVNWSEIARLRATYGFPSVLNEELFGRLQGAGLKLLESFPGPAVGQRFVEIYDVPKNE